MSVPGCTGCLHSQRPGPRPGAAKTTWPAGVAGELGRFREDLHARAQAHGREPESLVILQGIGPIVGRSAAEAEDKYRALADLVSIEIALDYLGRFFEDIDWSPYDLDAAFPDLGDHARDGWQSTSDNIKKHAKRTGMTLREVALNSTTPRHAFIGTPDKIVELMQQWFDSGGCDGFMIDAPVLPNGS